MALAFSAGTPLVNLGVISDLSGVAAVTCTAWLKLDSTTGDGAIVLRGATWDSTATWLFWRDDSASVSGATNTLTILINTNAGMLRAEGANNLLNDTDWHHVAWVFEANQADGLRLFVDGVRDSNAQSTVGHSSMATDSLDATIGNGPGGHHLEGSLAELTLWNTALDDQTIATLAAGFSPWSVPQAGAHLKVYQDLVRGLNRPGVGPTASATGTLVADEHPRQLPAGRLSPYFGDIHNPLAGPYVSAAGALSGGSHEAGAAVIPGIAAGTLTPIGEVLGG